MPKYPYLPQVQSGSTFPEEGKKQGGSDDMNTTEKDQAKAARLAAHTKS